MAKGPAKLTLLLGAEVSESFKKSISKVQRRVLTFNEKVKRSFSEPLAAGSKGFKNVLRSDAFQTAAVAAGGLGFALKGAVTTAMDFEKSMQAVAAVSGATGKDFTDLTGLAKDLGRTTQFSATEAAGAMEMLSMAGLNTKEILDATGPTLDLAAAGAIELSEAADIATNVMGGMSLQVSDLGKINDVLAKTSSSANTNVREMAGVFEKVGGVAPGVGASLEQISGMAGILANSGIKSAEAGTALRNVMLRLASEDKAKDAIASLGISATDAAGNMRAFPDILADIENQMQALGKTEEERATLQKEIFGLRSAAAGGILQEAAANGELGKMIETVTNSQGAASEQAKKRQQGLAGSMKRLQSAAEGLAIAFGGPLLGPIASVAETLAAVLGPVAGLLGDMPILATLLGAVAAAFIGITVAMPIIGAVTAAVAAFKLTMIGAWVATLGPIGLIIAAVAVVIGIFQLLYKRVEPFRNFVDALWNEIRFACKAIAGAFMALPGVVGNMVSAIGDFFAALPARMMEIIESVKTVFATGFNAVKDNAGKIVGELIGIWFFLPIKIAGFVNDIVKHFTGIDLFDAGKDALKSMWDGFQQIWPEMINWLVNGFKNAMGRVGNAINPMNWFGGGGNDGGNPPTTVPNSLTAPSTSGGAYNPMGPQWTVDGFKALGGPVIAGGSYIVGEQGPELFTPSRSGQIFSNRDTAALFSPQALGDSYSTQQLDNRSASVSLAPTININVNESNATADDIAAAVARGLDDALMEAEAGVRALLND